MRAATAEPPAATVRTFAHACDVIAAATAPANRPSYMTDWSRGLLSLLSPRARIESRANGLAAAAHQHSIPSMLSCVWVCELCADGFLLKIIAPKPASRLARTYDRILHYTHRRDVCVRIFNQPQVCVCGNPCHATTLRLSLCTVAHPTD